MCNYDSLFIGSGSLLYLSISGVVSVMTILYLFTLLLKISSVSLRLILLLIYSEVWVFYLPPLKQNISFYKLLQFSYLSLWKYVLTLFIFNYAEKPFDYITMFF